MPLLPDRASMRRNTSLVAFGGDAGLASCPRPVPLVGGPARRGAGGCPSAAGMRAWVRRAWMALLLPLCLLAPGLAVAETSLDALLGGLKTLSGGFAQRNYGADGGSSGEVSGRFALERPGRLFWQIEQPYRQLLLLDDRRLTLYDEDLAQVTVKPVTEALDNAPIQVFLSDRPLREAFAVQYLRDDFGVEWFELRPLAEGQDVKVVRIGLADGVLVRMDLLDALGQISEITLTRVERNPTLPAGQFRFVPPPGVDVVEAR